MEVRVVSIGTLAEHPLRDRSRRVRTGHATTTLIRSEDAVILVDPGLPGPAVVARLDERAGLDPSDVTHVFLTSFQADTCRGIEAFAGAEWLIAESEREGVGVPLATMLRDAADAEEDAREELEYRVALLRRCRPAPDRLARGVDLFPLPGVTPGLCGLLVSSAQTVLVCGDAIPTVEHLEHGRVPVQCVDPELALESFREAVEIADVLVPGRDNVVINPTRRPA